ncbi:MAG: helix-turn-helix transcriptional regulator [Bacteroidia bacterium]
MEDQFIRVNSISEIHKALGLAKPSNPLISVIDAANIQVKEEMVNTKIIYDFYVISFKNNSDGILYGRNSYDFAEGTMAFGAPGQVYTPVEIVGKGDMEGWIMYFHPDLILGTSLATNIYDYSFFNYEIFEALHLSEQEELVINATIHNIQNEYSQRIDNHSQSVLVSNLELLLNYCNRFYERQFNTRTTKNKDIVNAFDKQLREYINGKQYQGLGLPSIAFFAEKANLSQHYFSDLIKKETGQTPKDHINNSVIDQAKTLLLGTQDSISEIAYDLGFNYPHYFTRLFKSKTGMSPVKYRKLN